jgi:hypothetical protein
MTTMTKFHRRVGLAIMISLLSICSTGVASAKAKAKVNTEWKKWLVVTDKSVGYPCLELPRRLFPKVAPKRSGASWAVESNALLTYSIEYKTIEDASRSDGGAGETNGKAPWDGYPGLWKKVMLSSGEVVFTRYIEYEDELAVISVALDDNKTSVNDLVRMTNLYSAKSCLKG